MRAARDRGAVAVETVFALGLLLIPLMIGVADYGRAIYTSIILEEIAQDGANFMVLGNDSGAVEQFLIAENSNTSGPELVVDDISASCVSVSRTVDGVSVSGSRATVSIIYDLDGFFTSGFELQQQAIAEGITPCG